MTHKQSSPATPAAASARQAGEASGKHQGLHQPGNARDVDDKLENVDLESRGVNVEDHLRDSRSKGVSGAYDDSIEHDADEGYTHPGAGKGRKRH